jgi:hypothetical protein
MIGGAASTMINGGLLCRKSPVAFILVGLLLSYEKKEEQLKRVA